MINIYGPHEIAAKSSLWSRMSDFIQTHEGHFIIFGDMNEVRDESERYGTVFLRAEAQTFNSLIDDAGFIDLPLGCRSYTWMNKAGTKMRKLDRFLVSNSVMDAFPDLKATALTRGWSDHIPLMLHSEKVNYGPVPFKIFHSWTQRDGFEEVIKTAYEECSQGYSNQYLTFHEKLKFIKQKIKAWSHNVKRGDASRYQEFKLRLIEIEEKIDKRVASDEERQEMMNLLKECDDLNKLQEMDTFQKARVKWDVEDDENSKFFHGILKQKRNQQMVKGIMINGEWVTNPQQVKMAFLNFYKEKFDDHASRMIFSLVTPQSMLNEAECGALESRVTMDEIRTAVWDCESQKAPGPDGFSFLFIKKYWEILKHDIETSVVSFFYSLVMPKGANSSFITLIPKVANPIHIKDFRHISLIGVQYKIIAKILENRLAKVVDKVISHEQSAFISGRQFLEGPLMLSEVMDWYKSRNKKLMIFKVDFEKAYDSRGLRQGDPLSPFLFIIIMEGLHLALKDAVQPGLLRGAKLAPSPTITTGTTTSPNPTYATWHGPDQRALILIQSSLSEEAMAEILGHTTARATWCALEAAYSHDSVERMHTLRDSLRQIRKGSSTVVEFAWKFKTICDQLNAIGHPLDDTDKSHWFLCGLGSSFETFSTTQRLIRPRPSFRDIVSQAESHELFLQTVNDAQERIQHISNLQGDCLEIEEQLLEVEAEAGYAINIADEEINLEEQAISGFDDSE
uniref:RNA-directed DNA polymerase, eukaryota n=1 Tax=Tanacetum cinerariifolium TaxID=118510 RepID=A0A699I3F2_TANCI|nr:RNA-directed DNA polymerase, eukaryota [Tanacetum cinerariifolium]